MWRGQRHIRLSGLRQRLLSRPGCAASQRGAGLIEWMVAQALGLLIAALAISLFLHQGYLVAAALQRQFRDEDLHALMHLLRAELRVAGQRQMPGPEPDHDQLAVEGQAGRITVQYLCDRCGAADRTRAASIRLQSSTLSYRHPGASAHQALHDGRLLAVEGWRIQSTPGDDCTEHLTVQLDPQGLRPASATLRVRPRNLGLTRCESRPPATGTSPTSGGGASGTRASGPGTP